MNEQAPTDKWEDVRLGHSQPVTAEQIAVAFDHWSVDDIREFLDDEGLIQLAMAYFDRCGYEFYWYERAADAPASLVSKTGLIWSNKLADLERAARSGAADRQLLEDWLDRIKPFVRWEVSTHGLPIPPGFHRVTYRLATSPDSEHVWEHAWERETDT